MKNYYKQVQILSCFDGRNLDAIIADPILSYNKVQVKITLNFIVQLTSTLLENFKRNFNLNFAI